MFSVPRKENQTEKFQEGMNTKWEKSGRNYIVNRMGLLCDNVLEGLFHLQTVSKCTILNLTSLV